MICPKCGAEGAVRNGAGRGTCREGRHTFVISPEMAAAEAADARTGNAQAYGIDRPLPEGLKLKGVSTLIDKRSGETVMEWVKADEDSKRQAELREAALVAMAAKLPRISPRKASGTWRADLLTVYPIGDPHIGMYAWGDETGDDWDLSIAERVHCAAMASLVQAAPETEQAVILNLGDLFHYDGLAAVTPRSGHNLDADGRYAKMVHVGIMILRQCIESALTKHKRVHVMSLPGNHDESSALFLQVALRHIYEREPRVTIEASPSLFQYYRFGKVLIGAHHGHTCKPDKLPGVMAADRAQDWGETTLRHWLIGHVHHESRKEFAGCTVESFNTLAGKDAYATNGGWRSNRTMQAIVYHKDGWLMGRSQVAAEMFQEAA